MEMTDDEIEFFREGGREADVSYVKATNEVKRDWIFCWFARYKELSPDELFTIYDRLQDAFNETAEAYDGDDREFDRMIGMDGLFVEEEDGRLDIGPRDSPLGQLTTDSFEEAAELASLTEEEATRYSLSESEVYSDEGMKVALYDDRREIAAVFGYREPYRRGGELPKIHAELYFGDIGIDEAATYTDLLEQKGFEIDTFEAEPTEIR